MQDPNGTDTAARLISMPRQHCIAPHFRTTPVLTLHRIACWSTPSVSVPRHSIPAAPIISGQSRSNQSLPSPSRPSLARLGQTMHIRSMPATPYSGIQIRTAPVIPCLACIAKPDCTNRFNSRPFLATLYNAGHAEPGRAGPGRSYPVQSGHSPQRSAVHIGSVPCNACRTEQNFAIPLHS